MRECHPREWVDYSGAAYRPKRVECYRESHPRQRLCEKVREYPNFSWGIFMFSLRGVGDTCPVIRSSPPGATRAASGAAGEELDIGEEERSAVLS